MNSYIHDHFEELPVADTCTWPGTEYIGTGKDAVLKQCGEPTVGGGLFCTPTHNGCMFHSVCERHDNNGMTSDWGEVA